MSGGYFYGQCRIGEIADSINKLIASNDDTSKNRYGDTIGRGYSPATIAEFTAAVKRLRIAEIYAQRVDWLVSGDDGEDSFHRRLADDLAGLEGDAP
jgi:hypothetical protein